MSCCAAVASETVLNAPVAITSAEKGITADAFACKYASFNIYTCDVDAHFLVFVSIHTVEVADIDLHEQ